MNTSSTGSPTSPDAEVLAADDEDDVEAAAVSEDAEDVLSAAEDDVEASDVDESAADAAAADVAAEEAELLPHPAMVATMAVLIRIAKSLRFISFLPLDTLRLLLPSQLSVLKTGNFRFY